MTVTASAAKQITAAAAEQDGVPKADHNSWDSRRPAAGETLPVAHPGETVLLVEREVIMRSVLARLLRLLGYQVMPASGGSEAQRLACDRRYVHLLFINLSDLERDDIELVAWFQRMHPETKIIVASDCLWDANYQLADSTRMELLAQPYSARALARLLRQLLD